MDESDITQMEDEYIRRLQDLIDQFGLDPVLQELKKHYPQVDFEQWINMSDEQAQALQEAFLLEVNPRLGTKVAAGAAAIGTAGWTMAKKLWSGIKSLVAPVGTGLVMGGANILSKAIGKSVDQDVNIAGQDSDVVLKVTNPALEALLTKTNELLALMAQQTADDLEQLDLSMDHVAAGLTGGSVVDVQGRQATGQVARPHRRTSGDPSVTPTNAGVEDIEGEENEEELELSKPVTPRIRAAAQ